MFISSFCSKLLIWVPVSFPSLLVPCIFCFISLWVIFTSSFILWPFSVNFVSILITSVLNSAPDRLSISSSLNSSFLKFWSVLSFGPYFFISVHLLCSKGWSLRYSPGRGNPLFCVVVLSVREGSEREQCCLFDSHLLPVISLASCKWLAPYQIFPLCWFLGEWAYVHPRTPLAAPTDSTERLAVCSPAASTTDFYSQRFWGFIFWQSTLLPSSSSQFLSTHECGTTWSTSHHFTACSLCPSCLSLPLVPVWMNVSSLTPWLSDFHTVWFSGSSACFLFLTLLLSFHLCKEAQCVYLHLHLGQKSECSGFFSWIMNSPLLFFFKGNNVHYWIYKIMSVFKNYTHRMCS